MLPSNWDDQPQDSPLSDWNSCSKRPLRIPQGIADCTCPWWERPSVGSRMSPPHGRQSPFFQLFIFLIERVCRSARYLVDVTQWVVNRIGALPSGEAATACVAHHCQALTLSGGLYPQALLRDRNSAATHGLSRVTPQSTRNIEPGFNFTRAVVGLAAGIPPISPGAHRFHGP